MVEKNGKEREKEGEKRWKRQSEGRNNNKEGSRWVCIEVESEQGNRKEIDMVIRQLRIIQLKTIE